MFGTHEYRTFKRAHSWIKSDVEKESMSRFERLLFVAQTGIDESSIDFDILFFADQVGRLICAVFEVFIHYDICFQAILISHSFFSTSPGGATLGKWLLNLKVVSCDEVVASPDTVEVFSGSNLGIFR